MLQDEVLIFECLEAPDAGRAGAVAVKEVTALAHEVGDLDAVVSTMRGVAIRLWVTYYSVELGALVALRPAS